MRAEIEWVPMEEGGRRVHPTGDGPPYYSPEVRFPDHPWQGADEAWSLVVRKIEGSSDFHHWVADVQFRVEEAPHSWLREGRDFELYEGKKLVARGKLVGEMSPSPMLETGSSAV